MVSILFSSSLILSSFNNFASKFIYVCLLLLNWKQTLIMSKTISDLIEVKNPRASGRYLKKKVAMGLFIEDYIAEKVDIKVNFMELLQSVS